MGVADKILHILYILGYFISSILLISIDLPVIQAGPADLNITLSNNATFRCQATGVPPITGYQWFFNDTLLTSSSHHVIQGPTLIIVSVTLADVGYYKCLVSNQVGDSMSNQAFLTVLRKKIVFLFCTILLSALYP